MEIKLHTFDIQRMMIALIMSDDHTPEEEKARIQNKLCELNKLCCEANDYTLTINVSA